MQSQKLLEMLSVGCKETSLVGGGFHLQIVAKPETRLMLLWTYRLLVGVEECDSLQAGLVCCLWPEQGY